MKTQLPSRNIMYKALIEKNSEYEGIFYAAIKTTGIFCRPTCFARKPKAENVEYFSNIKEALNSGYRPCKKCHPLNKQGSTPEWIKNLLQKVNESDDKKFKDYQLRQMGVDPVKLRRWFNKNYGITFQAYLRSLRINQAFGRLKLGDKITESAFVSGYESLSGFSEQIKKSLGVSPSKVKDITVIKTIRITTPLGQMLDSETEKGVCLLEFTDRKMLETQIKRLHKYLNAKIVIGENKHLVQLDKELKEYFDGKRQSFDVPLVFPGTEFQVNVWNELLNVNYGETRS